MKSSYQFRKADQKDMRALHAMAREQGEQMDTASPKLTIIGEQGGKIIGFIWVRFMASQLVAQMITDLEQVTPFFLYRLVSTMDTGLMRMGAGGYIFYVDNARANFQSQIERLMEIRPYSEDTDGKWYFRSFVAETVTPKVLVN